MFDDEIARQHEFSALVQALTGAGVAADQAERDAASIANKRIKEGARFVGLHPYSVGLLVERAVQREILERIQLDVVHQIETKTVDVTVTQAKSGLSRLLKKLRQ